MASHWRLSHAGEDGGRDRYRSIAKGSFTPEVAQEATKANAGLREQARARAHAMRQCNFHVGNDAAEHHRSSMMPDHYARGFRPDQHQSGLPARSAHFKVGHDAVEYVTSQTAAFKVPMPSTRSEAEGRRPVGPARAPNFALGYGSSDGPLGSTTALAFAAPSAKHGEMRAEIDRESLVRSTVKLGSHCPPMESTAAASFVRPGVDAYPSRLDKEQSLQGTHYVLGTDESMFKTEYDRISGCVVLDLVPEGRINEAYALRDRDGPQRTRKERMSCAVRLGTREPAHFRTEYQDTVSREELAEEVKAMRQVPAAGATHGPPQKRDVNIVLGGHAPTYETEASCSLRRPPAAACTGGEQVSRRGSSVALGRDAVSYVSAYRASFCGMR